MLRARLASVLVLALTGACTESPSFSVRWKLHPHTDAELQGADIAPLLSVKQCTELGISRMRVTTRDANGTIVNQKHLFTNELLTLPPNAVIQIGKLYLVFHG